jgi:hypothetical protein
MSEQTFVITVKDFLGDGKEIELERKVLTNFPKPDGTPQWVDNFGQEWVKR